MVIVIWSTAIRTNVKRGREKEYPEARTKLSLDVFFFIV